MRMQVEHVGFLRSGMEIAEHDRIVQIRVVDVGGVVAELFQQCRVAIRPGGQEEFFVQTFDAVGGRTNALAVGNDHRAHAACTVIDRETVLHAGKLALGEQAKLFEIARYHRLQLVMEEDRELAIDDPLALGALVRLRRAVNDRVQIGMDDLMGALAARQQHVEDGNAAGIGGLVWLHPARILHGLQPAIGVSVDRPCGLERGA